MQNRYFIGYSFLDYPDNSSYAMCIYIPGCEHNCENCHSKTLQTFQENLNEYDIHNIKLLLNKNKDDETKRWKIVITGGDPLHPNNLASTRLLINNLKKYEICIYTGYNIEQIPKDINVTYIKCGKYIEKYKTMSFKNDKEMQLASTNQKIYLNWNLNNNYQLISKEGRLTFL